MRQRFLRILSVIIILVSFASGCSMTSASDAVQPRTEVANIEIEHTQTKTLLISGVIEQGGKVGRLSTAYHVPDPVVEKESKGQYSVELIGHKGEILKTYYFDPTPILAQEGTRQPESGTLGFSFYLAAPVDTAALRLKHGATVLHELAPGFEAPRVNIVSPSELNGRISSQTLDLKWTASDPDGDVISYMVRYSSDGGQTWKAVGISLPQPTLTLDLSQLGAAERGLLQILASDGVNTGVATLGPFILGRKGPSVTIIAPVEGTVIQAGQPLILLGSGQDPEDGTLPDESLVWTSNLSGILGTGQTLQLDKGLPVGTHVITLTAQDSDGNQTSQRVAIKVNYTARGHKLRFYVLPLDGHIQRFTGRM
jgi:hypothetical protein